MQCTWLRVRGRLRGAPNCMNGVRDGFETINEPATPVCTPSLEINQEETFVLPDGNFSTAGAERFRYIEVLLPESTILLSRATQSATFTSAMKCTPCCAIKWHDNFSRDFGEHDKELTA